VSLDPSKVIASAPRTVEIVGIGPVVVRRATLADISLAGDMPYWWARLFTLPDGSPLFAPGVDVGTLDHEVASALIDEVNRPRFTTPPNGGSTETQVPKCE
tara:strand:+ start:327 stop:629 length:303 start_codon:yes stop_codon:yes gene_type:complete